MESRSRPKRLLPPVALVLSIVSMVLLDRYAPVAEFDRQWLRVLGGVIIIAALGVNTAIALSFKRRGTTVYPFRDSSVLVTGGLFRYTRNPVYVSMVVVLLGVATVLGSASPLVVIPLFILWITRSVIRVEEQMLAETFGDEYREYQHRVRRWV